MIYQLFVLYFIHKFWRPANASVDYDSCDCFITAEQIKISISDTVLMNWCWSRVFVWQVMSKFQRMRQEQRSMASKAAELEMEINEHRFVANIPPLHIWPRNPFHLTISCWPSYQMGLYQLLCFVNSKCYQKNMFQFSYRNQRSDQQTESLRI